MPNQELLDRVCIILVRARNPNNIGAVARAMHDFGFRRLRLVNDYSVPFESARSAVDASAVLAAASIFPTVAEAIADCSLVYGTTAVGERVLEHPLQALPAAAATILSHLAAASQSATQSADPTNPTPIAEPHPHPRIALLFGSEKTGLSNDELSHCSALLTIPMQQHDDLRHPSMNLGQAVAVCLWELVRQPGAPAIATTPTPASAAVLERLTTLMIDVLERTGYRRHHPANSDDAQVRRLVHRLGLSAIDAPVWMGFLRQILWHTDNKQ